MLILTAIDSVFALGFLLVGLVALFGIGITGLLFLGCGIVFAGVAAVAQEASRAGVVLALAANSVLAVMAARALGTLVQPRLLDVAALCAILVLVAIGAVAVACDWRRVRDARWF